jgi:hypothetical protein
MDIEETIAAMINIAAAEGFRVVRLLVENAETSRGGYADTGLERERDLIAAVQTALGDLDQASVLTLALRPERSWGRDPRWYALLTRLSEAAMALSLALKPNTVIVGHSPLAAGAEPANSSPQPAATVTP